jgi:hypothetical protein
MDGLNFSLGDLVDKSRDAAKQKKKSEKKPAPVKKVVAKKAAGKGKAVKVAPARAAPAKAASGRRSGKGGASIVGRLGGSTSNNGGGHDGVKVLVSK